MKFNNKAFDNKVWISARDVIKQEFTRDPSPGGMRHAFLANIAMLLYDRYQVDPIVANDMANDIIKLAFEDTYY